ncbi:AAA domain-containing protein [Epithele typhae]|uniref:AAA domain-containing protein n=1 Tax=Epithele typhae TaxID=378194 RepID=UPI0020086F1A|nr:AAA domain-containing protein [Epithele typhae]KAH9925900.1 AAA domain-containing protein [Epithele typhae]
MERVEVEHRPKAVFVLGPSSSGKTTLCEALSKKLGVRPPLYIKEVAREVMATHGFTRSDVDTFAMQHAIMLAQLVAEEKAMSAATEHQGPRKTILSDRSAIDPIVYAATSQSSEAKERHQRLLAEQSLQEILPWYQESLFVDEWLEDDGVRSLEDPWKYSGALRSTLDSLGISRMTLGKEVKSLEERVELVCRKLEQAEAIEDAISAEYQ